jgi:hypothetical protein
MGVTEITYIDDGDHERRSMGQIWVHANHNHEVPSALDIGTTVVSLSCIMRRREVWFGSGHATSATVVIQSARAVTRCFAARRGRTTPLYDASHSELSSWSRRKVEHLALESEIITRRCSTQYMS